MRTNETNTSRLWTGRVISALCVLFLLFDSVIHILNIAPVVQAFAKLGYSDSLAAPLGVLELICIVLYVIPRTSVFGAILLTGYLGGATASNLRIGDPFLFSVFIGVLVWTGLALQHDRLRSLLTNGPS
ncbi:MAG: hypothetical protein QOJ39_1061 [Candidatus Eremiobacteraeota bacterium]|nr:hypothetical protein [Candidatus Eremiobacteraeota bacterium]